ncbi:MAG: hypothetical protein HKM89_03310 [Gemmatimonadales bacterium]|nr:hypothetical protein [Gemmatimonadales bacterium]
MSRSQGYSDAFYGPDYIVPGVIPGGPAESAGFQAGDRVVTVENIPVEGLGMQSRWPRAMAPKVGRSHRFVVERDGELVTLNTTYTAIPRSVIMLRLGAALVGLAFLWSGVWALFRVGTVHAERLAAIGLAAGVAMTGMGPSLGRLNGVVGHIQFAAMILWAAFLLRFFLTFPTTKRPGASTITTRIIYGLWLLFLPVLVIELITHPTLYHTYGGPGYLLMLTYLMFALAAAMHTGVINPRWKLKQSGMGVILMGLLVGIVPALVGFFDWAFMREFDIPTSVYWPVLLSVIPLTMAIGVHAEARARADSY